MEKDTVTKVNTKTHFYFLKLYQTTVTDITRLNLNEPNHAEGLYAWNECGIMDIILHFTRNN